MIKTNIQKAEALKEKQSSANIIQPQLEEQKTKSIPKSQRKLSFSQSYNRKSYFLKQKSQIPTLFQAKQRQKQIIKFHNRNFHQRQRRLEEIFKQNCRIYVKLNTQKSFYSKNFNKENYAGSCKSPSNSNFVSRSEYSSTKMCNQQKQQKFLQQNELPEKNKFQRRYSLSIARPKKQRQIQKIRKQLSQVNNIQSEMNIDCKRFEKNKTEMLPRKNLQLNLGHGQNITSVMEIKTTKHSEIGSIKNPIYIRFKKRPSSGFRC